MTRRSRRMARRLRRMTPWRLFGIRRPRREACRALFKARRPRRDIRRRFFLSKKAFRASRPGIRARARELSKEARGLNRHEQLMEGVVRGADGPDRDPGGGGGGHSEIGRSLSTDMARSLAAALCKLPLGRIPILSRGATRSAPDPRLRSARPHAAEGWHLILEAAKMPL
jgi:hypothetical protein